MIGIRDSVAVSGVAHRATTPLAPGVSDLACLGGHLDSPPLPKIHIQDDADQARPLRTNKVALALNDLLESDGAGVHETLATGIHSLSLEANRPTEDGTSQRSRSDSLNPDSSNSKLRGAPGGSVSSHNGLEIDLDGDDSIAQLTRRTSSRGPLHAEEEQRHGSALDVCAPWARPSSHLRY
jgi:hypothetical protein